MSGRSCPECKAPLESGALEGMCPRCLAGLLFDPGPAPESLEGMVEAVPSAPPMTTRSVLLELPGYEVTRELARGGMGIVYQATQLEPRREVALKMLLPHQLEAEAFRERFLLEARAIARLEHPAILPVYQVGEHDGVPFFTMKLAAGGTLAERRQRYRRGWREIAELVATLSEAVQYAHERGVLHRDLKPGNVLFDDKGRPYVSDFGLAKLADDTMPEEVPGQVIGTPRYVAPEVAGQGSELATVSSDIYGLGVILYELLAQKTPFVALSHQALLRMVADSPPPPPGEELKGVPRELDLICMRCLEKSPERRFQTAGSLAQELRRWLGGLPLESMPTSRGENFWRWFRERQVVAGLTVAIVVLGLVLVIGSMAAAFSLAASRRAVVEERDRARGDLVSARLGEARGLRVSDQIRVRSRALELLAAAAKADASLELRNEAAALLSGWDVDPEEERHAHTAPGMPLAFSAGLETVADARPDGETRVWRRATGSVLWKGRPLRGLVPERLEFSRGARWLAVAAAGVVQVAESGSGRAAWSGEGRWIGFSSDERFGVVQTLARRVLLVDLATGSEAMGVSLAEDALGAVSVSDEAGLPSLLVQWPDHLEVLRPEDGRSVQWLPFHRGEVSAVAWQDGCVVVGDNTGGLRVWNLLTGRLRDLPGHRSRVRRIVLAPGCEVGWSTGEDGESRLWHVRTGRELGRTEVWEPLRFDAEGRRMAFVDGGAFGVTALQGPLGVRTVALRGGGDVRQVEFSPDGRWLAVAARGGVSLLDGASGASVGVLAWPGTVGVQFGAGGKELAVIQRLGIRWYELREEGRRLVLDLAGEMQAPSGEWLLGGANEGDGRHLLLTTASGRLARWDLVSKRWVAVPDGFPRALAAAADAEHRWLALRTAEPRLEVYPYAGGKRVLELEAGVAMPAFSPDGRHLLITGGEMHRVLSVGDWRPRMVEPTGAGNMIMGMGCWSRYGRAFVLATPRSGVVVASTETWNPLVRLEPSLPATALAIGPHGRRIAVGTLDDHVDIWSLPELEQSLGLIGLAWEESVSSAGSGGGLPAVVGAGVGYPGKATYGRILPRASGLGGGVLDLGVALNESLDAPASAFTSPRERADDFPVGAVVLGGEGFDVRGYMRLAGGADGVGRGRWPKETAWVGLGHPIAGLSVVSSVLAGQEVESGELVARMQVRWKDGGELEVPVRYGFETGSYWVGPGEVAGAEVVWQGLSEASEARGRATRLYRHRWVNPQPGRVVDRIRWVSSGGRAGLRVAGVSAWVRQP